MDEVDLSAAAGFIEPSLHAEFPGLRLDWVSVEARDASSPEGIRSRLATLSSRFRGNSIVAMRTQPIPLAYRSFYRHIGLDPDSTLTPCEAAALERLRHGGYRSAGLVRDALLIPVVETGVPVWAIDAQFVAAGGLGIRSTVEGDRLGTTELGDHLPPGQLAIADTACVQALLFGDIARGHEVTKRTRRIVLFAVAVDGVPSIHIEEALWLSVEVLTSRAR
jgi:DNA/RNA-binding domain of Phe-tRNA-synthetase-like protein